MIKLFHRRSLYRAASAALARYESETGDTRHYAIELINSPSAATADRPHLFRLTASDRQLVMKLDPRDPPSDRLRRESDRLHALQPVFAKVPHFSILEPVHLDSEGRFLVTAFVAGPTAYAAVQAAKSDEDLSYVARRGAQWLSVLHGSERASTAAYEPDWVIRRLFELSEGKGADAPALGVINSTELIYQLAQRLEPVRHIVCPRVASHGDFTGDNLILSGDQTTGLDVAAVNHKLAVYDIADFLINLDLGRPDHALWDADGRATGPLLTGFLDGYDVPIPSEIVEAALISRLTIQTFRINRRQYLWHRHRRRRLARMTARLARIFPA